MKWLLAYYPLNQVIFFRSIFAFVPLFCWIYHQKRKNSQKLSSFIAPKSYPFVIFRGFVMFIAFSCFVVSLSYIQLATMTSISFATPLFTVVFAIFLLNERLSKVGFFALLFGFMGMIFIVKPSQGSFANIGTIAALTGSVFFAISRIITRKYGRVESTESVAFWTIAVWSIITSISILFSWHTPDLKGWLLLIVVGLLGGVAEAVLVKSMQIAPASIVGPVQYTQLIWAIFFGIVIWQEYPDIYTLFGAMLVIVSTLYMTRYETRKERSPQ